MADETPPGIAIGDRSQGYEVTGRARIAGLDAAFAGKDARDRDADVTLIWLSQSQDQSALFDSSSSYERLGDDALVGLRTVVRFGGGSAAVIGKEQGAPLTGETLGHWLKRRAPLALGESVALLLPALKALRALHAQGLAHGRISASQALVASSGHLKLLGPWLAEGGEAQDQFTLAQAPELVSGDAARPVSDVYSMITLLYWMLSGNPAPSAEARLASKAQRDEDPLQAITNLVPGLPDEVARAIETGLRLHPATRPQSMDALVEVLEPHAGPQAASTAAAAPPPLPGSSSSPGSSPDSSPTSTRQTPWGPKTGTSGPGTSGSVPPPLPTGTSTRSAGVPPIPKRTSTIGQAPPALPKSAGQPAKPKRRIGIGTIISFVVALAVAWVVASGGMFGGDEPSQQTAPPRQVDNQRDTSQPETIEVENQPRKGPRPSNELEVDDDDDLQEFEDASDRTPDGVTQQFCTSRFTYETARDAGTNALRAYLRRCNGVDSEFVGAARDELDG